MKLRIGLLLCLGLVAVGLQAGKAPRLLIRIDDLGMTHAVNMAAQQVVEQGFPLNATVMFACPWYQEAVAVLKDKPQVSVGVHLVLNSEWVNYRWGPVAGVCAVPSLVDENGFFWANHKLFDAHAIKLPEVEAELRAQLQRALRSGIRIDSMDPHMGTATGTPELRAISEKLANEYQLAQPHYFGEIAGSLFEEQPENKTKALVKFVEDMKDDGLYLMVIHTGLEDPEMNALRDADNVLMQGKKDESVVSRHRHAELKALISEEFKQAVKKRGAKLITYRDLAKKPGLLAMKRPEMPKK
ncbi:MAG: ChbG/HpnK family deacetylase [candidate division FCPU426 bacterium]